MVTEKSTSVTALEAGLDRLAPGGRIAVICYVGHAGGREEAEAVENLFKTANRDRIHVLRIENYQAPDSPFLLLAEKYK